MEKFKKYRIKDPELWDQVLTHKSWTKSVKNNEKLEFLGDAVLNLISAELLMEKQPQAKEGELSKKRSLLVKGPTLAKIAIELDLQNLLKTSVQSYKTNHRILAGALEAYIGAFYLENSFDSVKQMVKDLFKTTISQNFPEKNYKSLLQEWCQKNYKEEPAYKLKKEEGLEHEKTFLVEVSIQNQIKGTGSSQKKKQAEQKAALQALQNLKIPIEEDSYEELI